MSVILDGSVTLAWCFDDESTSEIDAMMMGVAQEGAFVPSLWRLEVANGLQMGIRCGRMTIPQRDSLFVILSAMDIAIDEETDRYAWSATLRLAERHKLTIYDASYLELAVRRSLPLASLDKALRQAARSEGLLLQ